MFFPRPSLILLALLVLAAACDKKDDGTPTPPTPSNPIPPADPRPDAIFTAAMVDSYFNGDLNTVSNATAVAYGPTWIGLYIGDVSLNNVQLDTSFGLYSISGNNSSLDLSSGNASWYTTGGSGFQPITQQVDDIAFPTIGPVNSPDTIRRSQVYTFSCANVSGADSVSFALNFNVRILAGNATSVTLTPSETAAMQLGSTYASIVAITYTERLIGNRRCQFRKQRSTVKVLVVTD